MSEEIYVDVSACRATRWVTIIKAASGAPLARVHTRVPPPEEFSVIKGHVRVALDTMGAFPDEIARKGAMMNLLTREVAKACVIGWTGVAIDQKPAPVTPQNVEAVLSMEEASDAYWTEFVQPVLILPDLEKKTLRSGPHGILAAGLDTAETAKPPDAPAPEGSASTALFVPTANTLP